MFQALADFVMTATWQIAGVILFLSLCVIIGINIAYPEWAEYDLTENEETKNEFSNIYMIKSKKVV